MHNEYIKLIAELDKTLSMVRSLWMDAKAPDEKNKWRVRLDELLDERSRLMQRLRGERSDSETERKRPLVRRPWEDAVHRDSPRRNPS